jgi:hypothetical protein
MCFYKYLLRHIRNDQQYAMICTTSVFYILAPTCFGSSLPSSGSFFDPSELHEIQIEWVVCHIICGYVTFVPTTTPHTGHVTTHYMIQDQAFFPVIFTNGYQTRHPSGRIIRSAATFINYVYNIKIMYI